MIGKWDQPEFHSFLNTALHGLHQITQDTGRGQMPECGEFKLNSDFGSPIDGAVHRQRAGKAQAGNIESHVGALFAPTKLCPDYLIGFAPVFLLAGGPSSSPGGGAVTLRLPADGGFQPSFDGPFWKKNDVLLSGCPV